MKQLIYYVCVYFSAADDTDDTDFYIYYLTIYKVQFIIK